MNQHYNLTISIYNEGLPVVDEIINLIEKRYSDLFYAVIVHGSVATNEIIKYSDFDGLLIVKDECINSKQLLKFKRESMKYIYQFDPLQHHGWFEIKESDLLNYPQSYFPYEILVHSKLIFPIEEVLNLSLTFYNKQVDYVSNFKSLIKSVEMQINLNWKSQRIYELKSFLSKIMLLPSMYYAAKNSEGIYKKHSFNVIKESFTNKDWECIEVATKIRNNWSYVLNPIQKRVMTRQENVFRKITKKYCAPKINEVILNDLNDDFFASIKLLLNKMNNAI